MTAQVLVIGSNGQLGSSIRNQTNLINSEFTFFFADSSIIDLSNISSIDDFFSMKKFRIIINCGAFTNVDGSEREKFRSLVSCYLDLVAEGVRLKCRYKSLFRKEGNKVSGDMLY